MNCGFVGIIGLPNVGKSTLLNKIISEKVSIVSSKPQTTRQSASGILSTGDFQIVFLDAPGFVRPQKGMFEFLSTEFDRVVEDSDYLTFVVSHDQRENKSFNEVITKIENSGKPFSFIFSKADLEEKSFSKWLKSQCEIKSWPHISFSIKDKEEENLNLFLQQIAAQLPEEKQPLYDPETISLENVRDIVGEKIREQCFEQLHQEIPFGLGVIIKSFKTDKGMPHIEANILVEKENHKAIVIGKKGAQLKKIGAAARSEIENFLGEKVYLGLHVSHKQNWMKNKNIMKELGYVQQRR